jgi:parallel beta-helix repeat protein
MQVTSIPLWANGLRHRAPLPLLFLVAVVSLWSCKDDGPDAVPANVWLVSPTDDYREKAQEALVNMESGDTLHFKQGTYSFDQQLSVSGKTGIVIRGEGRENTILDFSGQVSGAQGILATDMTDVIFADLTVQDMPGDGIKAKDCDGISFIRVGAVYSAGADPNNGAYGLYPVTSNDVLLEACYVTGASDAGIYVGQSEQVHVRDCFVELNVAGIEIENCINSDVYDNRAERNTGGILVFDLPGLPVIKNGTTCRVFNNTLERNNTINFAPEGNIVGNVPEGTGVMILSAAEVEVFDNSIVNCNIMGVGIVSFVALDSLGAAVSTDPEFDEYCYNIHVHNNSFTRAPSDPFGGFFALLLSGVYADAGIAPDIIWDGVINPDVPLSEQKICHHDNGGAQFADLDLVNTFAGIEANPANNDCTMSALPETALDAPELSYTVPPTYE